MKKIILTVALAALAVQCFAQVSSSPQARFTPLLSGYNVLAGTNGTFVSTTNTVQLGQSNVEFTAYSGQVLYSLTTNLIYAGVNGVTTNYVNTNSSAPDAFKVAQVVADVNGDINANAALIIMGGNTNFNPFFYLVTNSLTFQVSVFTNSLGAIWPLAFGNGYPNWNYPATPNTYPTYPANTTNVVTVNLYSAPFGNSLQGNIGNATPQNLSVPQLSLTAPLFSASFTEPAGIPWCVSTNIPTVAAQSMRSVWCSITVSTPASGITGTTNEVINQVGILQPQP